MNAYHRKVLGEAAAEASDYFGRHRADPTIRFALLRTVTRETKPLVFASMEQLARRIHRERGRFAIRLEDNLLPFSAASEVVRRRLTAVYTLSDSGQDMGFIGWAWTGGESRWAFKTALNAVEADLGVTALVAS